MASQDIVKCISIPANADLSGNQFYFVKVANNSGSGEAALADAGDRVLGVLQNAPDAQGKVAEVAIGGVVKVVADASITAGAEVASSSTGKVETAGTGDTVAGVALEEATADGDIIEIKLV